MKEKEREGSCWSSARFCSCRHIIHVNKWLLRLSQCSWRENRPDRDAGWKWVSVQGACEGKGEKALSRLYVTLPLTLVFWHYVYFNSIGPFLFFFLGIN